MKIEQYKSDVRTLVLSDSFKQSLKDKMANEFTLVATENTVKPWMKYSKYIATAACLVLIVATISVVSLMGGNFSVEKSSDNLKSENIMADDALYQANNSDVDESIDDMPVTEEEVIEEDAVVEEEIEEDIVVEEDEVISEVTENDDVAVEEEVAAEEAPAAPEEEAYKSSYAPEDYDGEYYAEDYIVGNETSPDYDALNVMSYDLGYDESSYSELSLDTLRYLDTVNFVKFTVEEAYSADDAVVLTGDEAFETEKSLYRINLTYDYLNNADLDSELYLAYPGTADNQLSGRPVLGEGEKYLSCLTFDGGYAEMLFELSYQVHRINGLDIAYHLVGGEGIDPGSTHMGMLDIEREVITTTINNPAVYTHKAAVKELTRYIKRNWTREEYPFTDFNDLGNSAEEDFPIISGEVVYELDLALDAGEVQVSFNGSEFDPKGDGSAFHSELSRLSNGSGSSSESSYLSFNGGRISFSSSSTFGGNIAEISMSEGTSLPIKINGVGIGDTMDALVEAFAIRYNVDNTLTLTISTANADGVAYTVTIKVVDNIISEIVIK